VADLVPVPEPPTAVAHAQALQLLDRYGVLTREMALAEGVAAGFAGVYPVLKAMEEQGQIRRGYFIAGLGAAQFATHAAVDRLREFRPADEVAPTGDDVSAAAQIVVLAATDPAQPYGAALAWPENAGRPTRSAGARVVLADGRPVAWLDRGARVVVTFPESSQHPHWVDALAALVTSGRASRLEVATVDGEPVATSPWADPLRSAGFADGYRGLVRRGS
jgi:ATP-dependent Lhr-like helicase